MVVVTIHRHAKDHSLFLTSFLDLLALHRLSGTEMDAEVLCCSAGKGKDTCCCTCGWFRYCEYDRYLLVQWTFLS